MSMYAGKTPRYNLRPPVYGKAQARPRRNGGGFAAQARKGRRDPTRTVALRRQYAQALKQRFAAVQKAIRSAVVDQDVFGLDKKRSGNPAIQQEIKLPPRFPFTMAPDQKIDQFLAWLNRTIDAEILEVTAGPGGELTRSNWQAAYVRSSYNKALATANAQLTQAGAIPPGVAIAFNLPIDVEALSLIGFRQFELLKGITADMSGRISQILTGGLADGIGPREIAKQIDKAIRSISIVRATILARTEIIRAYAEGTLNRYEALGIKEVLAEVEFATAGDDRVCKYCRSLDGKKYTIAAARGLIPVHPNCRCAWLPVVKATA